MNPVGGSYDESLLREAPAATREQLQEGYNPDILVAPTRHKSARQPSPLHSTPPGAAPPALPAFPHGSSMEHGSMVPVGRSFNSSDPLNEKPPDGSRGGTSFWGSPRGKIIMAVIIALVIIAAVVGGAVGGTVGKKTSKVSNLSSSTDAQAAGGSPTASATVAITGTNGGLPSTISFKVSNSATGTSFSLPLLPTPNIGGSLEQFANNQA